MTDEQTECEEDLPYVVELRVQVPPPEAASELEDLAVGSLAGDDAEMSRLDLLVQSVALAIAQLEEAFVEAGWDENEFREAVHFLVPDEEEEDAEDNS